MLIVDQIRTLQKQFHVSAYQFVSVLPDWFWLNRLVQSLQHVVVHRHWPKRFEDCRDLNDYWLLYKTSPYSSVFSYFVDKDLVKDTIRLILGEAAVIPTLKVVADPDALQGFSHSKPYVIKPTHSSRDIAFKAAGEMLTEADCKQFAQWLKRPLYRKTRESQYRFLKPKLIVEPLLSYQGGAPQDFKFMVVNGKVQYISWFRDKHTQEKLQLCYPNWERVTVKFVGYDRLNDPVDHPPPDCLPELITIAEKLGQLFPAVRVDLYLTDDGIKFGELTLTPSNGMQTYDPPGFLAPFFKSLPPEWATRVI